MRISDCSSDVCSSDLIAFHEKELGQLFCDDSSKQIVAMLLAECDAAGVQVQTDCHIARVQHADDGKFVLHTSAGTVAAPALVAASGGLSIPRMGASGFGYELARQFGHTVRSEEHTSELQSLMRNSYAVFC